MKTDPQVKTDPDYKVEPSLNGTTLRLGNGKTSVGDDLLPPAKVPPAKRRTRAAPLAPPPPPSPVDSNGDMECVQGWICKTALSLDQPNQLCQRTFTDKLLIMEHIKEKHSDKGRICKVLIRKKPDDKPPDGDLLSNAKPAKPPATGFGKFQIKMNISMDAGCRYCPTYQPTIRQPIEVNTSPS